jgi:predicted DNA-binding transcriptional regulator YafY
MYRRGDVGQVARALRVLDALRGFKLGRWVNEVAAEVAASERTVRRDISELQDAGFDIELSKHEGRVIARLTSEKSYSPVPITKRERFTLLAMRSVFGVLRGTPFLDDVNSVLAKLEQRMSTREREEHAAFGERFVYMPDHGTKSYAGKDDVIDAVQTGLLARKVVRYRYAGARGKSRDGFLAPYAMLMYRHGLYVIGGRLNSADEDTKSAPERVFAIERFADAEHLRDREFTVPPDFNLHRVLRRGFGPHIGDGDVMHTVVVEFTREKALYAASREWHSTQTIEQTPSGAVRVTFTCADLAPVVSWILEWGPHARAIAPVELVQHVKTDLERAHAQY